MGESRKGIRPFAATPALRHTSVLSSASACAKQLNLCSSLPGPDSALGPESQLHLQLRIKYKIVRWSPGGCRGGSGGELGRNATPMLAQS